MKQTNDQTPEQLAWTETLKGLRHSQLTQSRESWIEELTYGLRNLEVGDEEETRIEDMIEYQPESIRDHLQWTLDTLGYAAAYILYIQWIIIEPLKGISLGELQPAMLDWRLQWDHDDGDEITPQESKDYVDQYLHILSEFLIPVDRGQTGTLRYQIYRHLKPDAN